MKPRTVIRREQQGQREQSDAALFEAIARGDLSELGALFDRHHGAVRQFLLRAAPNGAEVDDIVQETFLTAARVAGTYDGRESARPFLVGIAVRLLHRRRRSFVRLRSMLVRFGVIEPPSPHTPEESTSRAEQGAQLHAAIARLSDDRRIALTMVELEGMSGVEVAKVLEVPVGTVWRWLHEARSELRRELERGAKR